MSEDRSGNTFDTFAAAIRLRTAPKVEPAAPDLAADAWDSPAWNAGEPLEVAPAEAPRDDIDDLLDSPRPTGAAAGAADYWGEVARLAWPLASDFAIDGAEVDRRRRQLQEGIHGVNLGAFREWVHATADTLVISGLVETKNDGLAIVVLGREWYDSLHGDPSLAGFLLTEQQRPELLERLLG